MLQDVQELKKKHEEQANGPLYRLGLLNSEKLKAKQEKELDMKRRSILESVGLQNKLDQLDPEVAKNVTRAISNALVNPEAVEMWNQVTNFPKRRIKIDSEATQEAIKSLNELSQTEFQEWSAHVSKLSPVDFYAELKNIYSNENYLKESIRDRKISTRANHLASVDSHVPRSLNLELGLNELIELQENHIDPMLLKTGLPKGTFYLDEKGTLLYNPSAIAESEFHGGRVLSDHERQKLLSNFSNFWREQVYEPNKFSLYNTPSDFDGRKAKLYEAFFKQSETLGEGARLGSDGSYTNESLIAALTRRASTVSPDERTSIDSAIQYLKIHPDERDLTGTIYFEDWQRASRGRARHKGSPINLNVEGLGNVGNIRSFVEGYLYDPLLGQETRGASAQVASRDPGIANNWMRVALISDKDSLSSVTAHLTEGGKYEVEREHFWPTDDFPSLGLEVASGETIRVARNRVRSKVNGDIQKEVTEVFVKNAQGEWEPMVYERIGDKFERKYEVDNKPIKKKCMECHATGPGGALSPKPVQHLKGKVAPGWLNHDNILQQTVPR